MSNNQTPSQGSTTEDPPGLQIPLTQEELTRVQTLLTIEKTKLEINKLKLEVKDLPTEPIRKWFTLTIAAVGAIIAACAALMKALEAPASPGVTHECSAPNPHPPADPR